MSSIVLIVTQPELLAVNQTARLINELTGGSLPADFIHVVVNKQSAVGISPQAVSQSLRRPVIGVIPQSLVEKELSHTGLSDLRVVGSMHERKALMAELSDAFIALPGGYGTFEEFCEVLTWTQLGLHRKPCGILNVEGYYDPLLALFDHAAAEQSCDVGHVGSCKCNRRQDNRAGAAPTAHRKPMEPKTED